MSGAWENNPQGNWDAWSIWNLRARFLAAGGIVAHRAWSPLLSSTHPEYPLLTSAFVARVDYGHTCRTQCQFPSPASFSGSDFACHRRHGSLA